jgi:hypothetical protein
MVPVDFPNHLALGKVKKRLRHLSSSNLKDRVRQTPNACQSAEPYYGVANPPNYFAIYLDGITAGTFTVDTP